MRQQRAQHDGAVSLSREQHASQGVVSVEATDDSSGHSQISGRYVAILDIIL